MHRHLLLVVLASIVAFLAVPSMAVQGQRAPAPGRVTADVEIAAERAGSAQVIVTLADPVALTTRGQVDRAALKHQIADKQQRVLGRLAAGDVQLTHRYEGVPAFAGRVSKQALQKLSADPDVAAITLDGIGSGADAESLPLIKADQVQTVGYTGTGVTAAVIDSGADLAHPDLNDDIVVQECFQFAGGCPVTGTSRASGPGAAQDDLGHGTNVTGIITSKGTVAPIGVAPNVKIAAYKALNSSNLGFYSDWIGALSDIIANHPNVRLVNMSLQSLENFYGPCDNFQPAATTAINTLRAMGTLTFAAAGNHAAKHQTTFPGCVSGAVSVGAVYDTNSGSVSYSGCSDPITSADRITCFSNSDLGLDILGPGAFIMSTGNGGGTSTYAGTSQATPHVVGVAALLLEANPGMTAGQAELRLKSTGTPIADPANGRITPRVDALNAISPVNPDGDLMPSAYESWHACLDAAVNDGALDPDGDGITTAAEFSAGTDPCAADSDGDGCADSEEAGLNPLAGGDRDPLNAWDFYDVPSPALSAASPGGVRNKVVGIQDVIAVVFYIGTVENGAANANGADYDSDFNGNGIADGAEYDRAASSTPGKLWRASPPNKAVGIQDAIVALNEVGTNCGPPP